MTTGRITPILDEYQAHWYLDDVFATAQSRATLLASPAITHTQLADVPSQSRRTCEISSIANAFTARR